MVPAEGTFICIWAPAMIFALRDCPLLSILYAEPKLLSCYLTCYCSFAGLKCGWCCTFEIVALVALNRC